MEREPLRKNREFMLLWSGEMVSEIGAQISTIAMPLLILALTGSPEQAGIVGLAGALAFPLFAIPAGIVADRVNRRKLMIACAAGRAFAMATVAIAVWAGDPPLALLVSVAFVNAGLFCTAYIAERGVIARLVPAEQLARAVTYNEVRTHTAALAGPPLGGGLFALGHAVPFAVDAISFVGSILAWVGIRTSLAPSREDRPVTRRSELTEGARFLWRTPFLRFGVFFNAGLNPMMAGLELLAIFLATAHGASPAAIGLMLAEVAVCGLIGASLAGPLLTRVGPRTALLAEPWLLVALLPLLVVVESPLAIGLVVGVAGMLAPLNLSIVMGRRIALTPDRLQGRVNAAASLAATSLAWVGPLAVGVTFERHGSSAAVLGLTAWACAIAIATSVAPSARAIPTALAGQ